MDKRFNPVFSIAAMFAITQIIGLAAGILLLTTASHDPNVQYLSVSPIEDANSPLNALFMIGYVLVGAGGALLIMKYFRAKILFRLLELCVVGATVSVLCFAFIFAFSGLDFFTALALSVLLGGAFALIKFQMPKLKNPAAILSSAGVGAMFGFSLGFLPALLFIVALAAYDYIAVFKTRHMLTLAQGLGASELSFTITSADQKAHHAPHG
ncbi:MAG: presenilin family intramembrane aspartyl protease, partial [Candidatus Micrarchaeota archaeon]